LRTGKSGLLGKHGKFGHGTYSDIDWRPRAAMAKVAISRRHWVTKHSSGVCGVKMMLLWKKRATALCPRCLLEVERCYSWQCQDPRALNVWTQAIANLETWMQKQRTEPGIIRVMCQALGLAKRIHRGDTSRNSLPAVVQKQDAIGWQSFLEGRPSARLE
jgi:hypothetical protein